MQVESESTQQNEITPILDFIEIHNRDLLIGLQRYCARIDEDFGYEYIKEEGLQQGSIVLQVLEHVV